MARRPVFGKPVVADPENGRERGQRHATRIAASRTLRKKGGPAIARRRLLSVTARLLRKRRLALKSPPAHTLEDRVDPPPQDVWRHQDPTRTHALGAP